MKQTTTTTLLRLRTASGKKLIGLWIGGATSTKCEENIVLKEKIAQVTSDIKEICILLAEGDKKYGVLLYRAYIRLLDQKADKIIEDL